MLIIAMFCGVCICMDFCCRVKVLKRHTGLWGKLTLQSHCQNHQRLNQGKSLNFKLLNTTCAIQNNNNLKLQKELIHFVIQMSYLT